MKEIKVKVATQKPKSFGVKVSLNSNEIMSYISLSNKPKINGVELVGNKTSEDLGLVTKTIVDNVSSALAAHIANQNNPHSVTKSQVGLSNVDNTSDINKPVSNAQKAAIDAVSNRVNSLTTELNNTNNDVSAVSSELSTHTRNTSNPHSVTKSQVGLGNVDNTSDANKPISNAQQDALDKKLDLSGGTLTGPLNIQGDLNIYGTASAEKQQSVEVKDTMIVTNIDGIDIKVVLSGLAMKMNDKDVYGIVYDPATNTVKLGLGTYVNKKFLFNSGEGLPLAIRADSSQFTAGHLVKWDATKNRLVDAGKGLDEVGKTPKSIDAVNGAFTSVTYDMTNGITLVSITKIINTDDSEYTATLSQEIPLVAGNGILIDKAANAEKIIVKIDQSKNFTIYGDRTRNGGYFTVDDSSLFGLDEGFIYTSYGDEGGIPTIHHKDPSGTYKYRFPTNVSGTHILLSNENVKTLFGDKSIVGEGNIDLYRHVIKITGGNAPYNDCFAYLTIISSKNLNVDSLADLKTLLGNTFEYPATGYDMYNLAYVYKVTQDGIISTNNQGSSVSLSFANMTVFIDTVTTV